MVKKIVSLLNKESELIHNPFHGEAIKGREAINIKIKTKDSAWVDVTLLKYSPFGLEFINNETLNLKKGDAISLTISLANDRTIYDGLIVNSTYMENEQSIVGVRTFIKDSRSEYNGSERRTHRRWICSEDFLPTGMASNPIKYNDFIFFRIDDISSGGLRLITSMRNKFLGLNQKLDAKLSIPYVGSFNINLIIKHINTINKDNKIYMVLGVEFLKEDEFVIRSLGEYLLNFAKDISVKTLSDEGFKVKNVSKWLDFSYVKTEAEYLEVLGLRFKAYKETGFLNENSKVEDMADNYDASSQIIIAKHNNKIVGSVRINSYNENDTIQYEEELNLIKPVPLKKEILEFSRLCTDLEYRGSDILYQLTTHHTLNGIKNNKKIFLIAVYHKSLIKYYTKCGWQRTGVYSSPKNTFKNAIDDTSEILKMDPLETIKGKNIYIKYWYKSYNTAITYLLNNKLIKLNFLDKLRLFFYKKIGALFY